MTSEELTKGIIANATTYVGMVETQDNSRWHRADLSDRLLKYMKRIAWWEPGSAYCAAFDGAVVIETLEDGGVNPAGFIKNWTAHCMTNARKMRSMGFLSNMPSKGALWLARHGRTDAGHAGITCDFSKTAQNNIEGNTSSDNNGSQRQGDGIYTRTRNLKTNGSLVTQGWVSTASILKLCGSSVIPVTTTPKKNAKVGVYNYLESKGKLDALDHVLGILKTKVYDTHAQITFADLKELESIKL